jgi:ATP-dependent exoDNAse (exonuclease V) beta subunit
VNETANALHQRLFPNEVIRASAGTGKTFALSNRFLRLLASGASCETILATTFTCKGAGEILDRIILRLADAVLGNDDAKHLGEELQWELDRERAQQILLELTSNIHRLQISTLDAFFYRIAQAFSLEMDLPYNWRIVEEQRSGLLRDSAIQHILRDETVIELLHLINDQEAKRSVAESIQSTVDNVYDIYLESDEAAWNRLPDVKPSLTDERLRQLAERLKELKYNHGSQKNQVLKEIELIESRDWMKLAESSIFARVAGANYEYYNKPLPRESIEIYQQLIGHCRAFVFQNLRRINRATYGLLNEFAQRLEADKNAFGELRFDDVTRRLRDFIADKQPDGFSYRLDHRVDHLLLDEFQDTSIPQWSVIKPFANRTTEPDSKRSFFCVGDRKQAIFGWRGGVAEIFDLVDEELGHVQNGQPLTTSYRSAPAIIELVNNVFGNLSRYRSSKQGVDQAVCNWAQNFEPHRTVKDFSGYASVEYAEDGDPQDALGESQHSIRNDNVLNRTVQRIQELLGQMTSGTIGVLVRTNETIGQLKFLLQQHGIPASEEGGNPLVDSAAVEHVLSALTLADHPSDGVARYHLSHGPLAQQLGLVAESLANQADNRKRAFRASEDLRRQLSVEGFGRAIEWLARMLVPFCTKRELGRLQQLVQQAYNYEDQVSDIHMKLRPSRFVEHIRMEFRARDNSSAQVRVMTVHQAKGLEFEAVVLPMIYYGGGWFSHQTEFVVGRPRPTAPIELACRYINENTQALLPPEFQAAFDESRRQEVREGLSLLYVALTRAIRAVHVIMSFSAKRDQSSGEAVLLATLCPNGSDKLRKPGIIYEVGDRNWIQQDVPHARSQQREDDLEQFYLPDDAVLDASAKSVPPRTNRGMPINSPSRMPGGEKIRLKSVFDAVDNSEFLRRGTLIHGCFQLVGWLDESTPDRSQLVKHLRGIDQ